MANADNGGRAAEQRKYFTRFVYGRTMMRRTCVHEHYLNKSADAFLTRNLNISIANPHPNPIQCHTIGVWLMNIDVCDVLRAGCCLSACLPAVCLPAAWLLWGGAEWMSELSVKLTVVACSAAFRGVLCLNLVTPAPRNVLCCKCINRRRPQRRRRQGCLRMPCGAHQGLKWWSVDAMRFV